MVWFKRKNRAIKNDRLQVFVPAEVSFTKISVRAKLSKKELRLMCTEHLLQQGLSHYNFSYSQLEGGVCQIAYFDKASSAAELERYTNADVIPVYVLGRFLANEYSFVAREMQIVALVKWGVVFVQKGEELVQYVAGLKDKQELESEVRRLMRFQVVSGSNLRIYADASFDTIETIVLDMASLKLKKFQPGEYLALWSGWKALKSRFNIKFEGSFTFKDLINTFQKNLYGLMAMSALVFIGYQSLAITDYLESRVQQQTTEINQLIEMLNTRVTSVLSRIESQSVTIADKTSQLANNMQMQEVHNQDLLNKVQFLEQRLSELTNQISSGALAAQVPAPVISSPVISAPAVSEKDAIEAAAREYFGEAPVAESQAVEFKVRMKTKDYLLVDFIFGEQVVPTRLKAGTKQRVKTGFTALFYPDSRELEITQNGTTETHVLDF